MKMLKSVFWFRCKALQRRKVLKEHTTAFLPPNRVLKSTLTRTTTIEATIEIVMLGCFSPFSITSCERREIICQFSERGTKLLEHGIRFFESYNDLGLVRFQERNVCHFVQDVKDLLLQYAYQISS